MKFKRIVFVHYSLGHYQYDRMIHLVDVCERAGIAFSNIEIASYEKANHWAVKQDQAKFVNYTLFPEQEIDKVPRKIIWPVLRTKLEELKPDVLFIYGYSDTIMMRAKLWAERNQIATVLFSDSNEFDKKRNKLFEFLKSLLVSRFDAAFVGGKSSSQYIQKLGIPKERVVPGFDIIDVTKFSQRSEDVRKAPDQIRKKWNLPENFFLFVGRFIWEKNLPSLLDAYKAYISSSSDTQNSWSLVLCGSGLEEAALRQHTENFPAEIKSKILFYGYIKQPEIIDFYACASCMILPSISESWGLVVNEALACKIPVIVSKNAGCALDLVENNVNGWVFNPYSILELTGLMENISTMEKDKRIQMGARGFELISEWGLDKYSDSVLKCAEIAFNSKNRGISQLWG